jgi:hypothetical protein
MVTRAPNQHASLGPEAGREGVSALAFDEDESREI